MLHFDGDYRVVLMCGVSGSGKTHCSRQLQQRGYTRLSTDEYIWEKYGSGFTALPFERQQGLFAEASAAIEQRLRLLLGQGEKVVVDATLCRRAKRDRLREICSELEASSIILYMQAPLPILRQRLAERRDSGPDDLKVSAERLEQFVENFESPADDELFITINPQ